MIDIVGYLAVATNILGNYLLARKALHGWTVRIVSIALWGVYAVGVASGPQLVNSIIFLFINFYGAWYWRRARGHDEGCKLSPCTCGRLA